MGKVTTVLAPRARTGHMDWARGARKSPSLMPALGWFTTGSMLVGRRVRCSIWLGGRVAGLPTGWQAYTPTTRSGCSVRFVHLKPLIVSIPPALGVGELERLRIRSPQWMVLSTFVACLHTAVDTAQVPDNDRPSGDDGDWHQKGLDFKAAGAECVFLGLGTFHSGVSRGPRSCSAARVAAHEVGNGGCTPCRSG